MWLKLGFDVIIGLFERFGIRTNVENMVVTVCHIGPISRGKSTSTYGQRITVKGDPQCAKQRWRLVHVDYGVELATAYMATKLHMQHGC